MKRQFMLRCPLISRFPTQSDPAFLPPRFVAILLFLVAIVGPGCTSIVANDPLDIEIQNARLAPPLIQFLECGQNHRSATGGRTSADWYWLAEGDSLCAYWDALIVTFSPEDDEARTALRCNLCDNNGRCPDSQGGIRNFLGRFSPAAFGPQARIFAATLPDMNDQRAVEAFGYFVGCASNSGDPSPSFTPPPGEGSLHLSLEAWASENPEQPHVVGDEKTVVVVRRSEMAFPMPLRLLEPVQPFDPANPDYFWRVEDQGGRFAEDFSPNLEVTRVRVLKGTYVEGEHIDAVGKPVPFRIENADPVVPLLVRFQWPAAVGNIEWECAGQAGSPDGDINMTNCRRQDNPAIIDVHRVTPRYAISPKQDNAATESLEWRVFFRSGNGHVIPSVGSGERLAIEFTLRVRP